MKFLSGTVLAALVSVPASAFLSSHSPKVSSILLATGDPQVLTEYMAKSHEDKLKAIKQLEDQKNAEIQILKGEIKALKAAPGALTTATGAVPLPIGLDVSEMSKEQLTQKLFTYQQFMAKYIVDAQEQKAKAVQAAQTATTQKFEEQLKRLTGTSSVSESSAPPPPAPTESAAFQHRTAKVSAAAAAGKSRWGDLENQKAAQQSGTSSGAAAVVNRAVVSAPVAAPPALVSPATGSSRHFEERNAMIAAAGKAGKSRWGEEEVTKATQAAASLPASSSSTSKPPPPVATVSIPVAPEVVAADHGLRADGGVGGPSLAERINFGSQLVEKAQSMAVALPSTSSATSNSATPPVVNAEVEAADHGLRADGGVSGPSLAQRVNFGSQLVEASSTSAMAASVPAPLGNTAAPASSTHFNKRNAMVAAAGKAGKSRWGEAEVEKAQSMAVALPSTSSATSNSAAPTVVNAEVEAADHGLRADGGVGGPSLAQRVNFGAALVE